MYILSYKFLYFILTEVGERSIFVYFILAEVWKYIQQEYVGTEISMDLLPIDSYILS